MDAYWKLSSKREQAEEHAFEREMPAYRERGELDKTMFVRLARWKSTRPTKHYLSNPEEEIQRATRGAFRARTNTEAIRALTRLHGVSLRTATALLHWMVPDRYPLLDVRVVASLQVPPPHRYEDPEFYESVAQQVRDMAGAIGVDLRTMDRALWAWDKAGEGA